MRRILVLTLLAACLTLCFGYTEKLIFYDEFNNFDLSTWKHAITFTGGGNWEFEQFVNNRSVSWVDNSVLYMKPMTTEAHQGVDITAEGYTIDLWGSELPDQCTSNFQYGCVRTTANGFVVNPITSARVRSAETFSFKYGRVEVKAKLPRGDWIWPAIWMMPRWNRYGPWPASGEIDIVESRGNKDYFAITPEGGVESVASTLHWGPYWGANGYAITRKSFHLTNGRDFADDFHTFGLYWDDTRLYTYVDNPANKVLDVDLTVPFWKRADDAGMGWSAMKFFNPWATSPARAPFNQEFFLIISNAVGGTNGYFPDNVPTSPNRNYPKPWINGDSKAFANFWKNRNMWMPSWVGNDTALRIDNVKVWGFEEISTWTINGISSTAPPLGAPFNYVPIIIAIVALVVASVGTLFGVTTFALLALPRLAEKWRGEKRGEVVPKPSQGIPLAEVQRQATDQELLSTSS